MVKETSKLLVDEGLDDAARDALVESNDFERNI
jgi:hypothetical protein